MYGGKTFAVLWLVIFAGTIQAKIQVSEIFSFLIFAVGEFGMPGLARSMAKSECLELFAKRDGNLSSLFQCDEESSLVPRMFVETIASALGTAVLLVHLCLRCTSISWIASAIAIKGTLTDTLLLAAR